MAVKPIPDGFHTVTPQLVIDGAADAIEFYKKALGAEELDRHLTPDGRVMHASLRVGNSIVMLNDDFTDWGPARSPNKVGVSSVTLHIYVEDCDAAFERAVAAGATVKMPLADMFWGSRYGVVVDPYGHEWSFATHKSDPTAEEIEAAAKEFFGPGPAGGD